MKEENRKLLVEGVAELGVELSDGQVDQLGDYLALLDKWGKTYNLTGLKDERDRVIELVLDSLAVVPVLLEASAEGKKLRVMDLGSGAGVPGIPVKIGAPALELVLCEVREKRAAFLRQVRREMNLQGLEVFEGRGENWEGEKFDAVVVKAVSGLTGLVEAAAGLLAEGGRVLAFKGPGLEKELERIMGWNARMELELTGTVEYQVPGSGAWRRIAVLEKP